MLPINAPSLAEAHGNRRIWLRQLAARMLWGLLLCGPGVIAACAGPRPDPEPVVIVEGEVRTGPEPGTWIVTDAWMARRLQAEHDLEMALQVCRDQAMQ